MSSDGLPAAPADGNIVWTNIAAEDYVRVRDFYANVFNWSFVNGDAAGEADTKFLYFKTPSLMGSFIKNRKTNMIRIEDATDASGDAALYLIVSSLPKAVKDIEANGGKKVGGVASIGAGFLQHFEDTEGNYIGLYSRTEN